MTRPAARQRPLPDAEICRRGSFMDVPFSKCRRHYHPRRVSESGRICRIVCNCARRRHQCCQLFGTRNAAHSRFMSSSWASRAPCLYAHRIAFGELCTSLSATTLPASASANSRARRCSKCLSSDRVLVERLAALVGQPCAGLRQLGADLMHHPVDVAPHLHVARAPRTQARQVRQRNARHRIN